MHLTHDVLTWDRIKSSITYYEIIKLDSLTIKALHLQIPVTWHLFICTELDSFDKVQVCNFICSYNYVCSLINQQSVTVGTTHQSQKCILYCSPSKHQITTPWRFKLSPQKTVFRPRSESIHSSSPFSYTAQILMHMTYQINVLIFVPVPAKMSCFPWDYVLPWFCSSSKTVSIRAHCAMWTPPLMVWPFFHSDNAPDSHSNPGPKRSHFSGF
jgi:hypothetical protein